MPVRAILARRMCASDLPAVNPDGVAGGSNHARPNGVHEPGANLNQTTIPMAAKSSRWLAGLAMLLLALGFAGCAAAPAPSAPPAAGQAVRADVRFQRGIGRQSVASCTQFNPLSFNTRCNAINKIAITMVQENGKITGFYKCTIGNMDCRNQNDSGTIANGSIQNGRLALRIGMPTGRAASSTACRPAPTSSRATTPAIRAADSPSRDVPRSRAVTERADGALARACLPEPASYRLNRVFASAANHDRSIRRQSAEVRGVSAPAEKPTIAPSSIVRASRTRFHASSTARPQSSTSSRRSITASTRSARRCGL